MCITIISAGVFRNVRLYPMGCSDVTKDDCISLYLYLDDAESVFPAQKILVEKKFSIRQRVTGKLYKKKGKYIMHGFFGVLDLCLIFTYPVCT